MSKEEYIKWKEENSSEYNSVLLRLMELVFKDLLSHSLDEVFLKCITPDAERRNVSYRDVVMALSGDEDKLWLKDELVMDLQTYYYYLDKRERNKKV